MNSGELEHPAAWREINFSHALVGPARTWFREMCDEGARIENKYGQAVVAALDQIFRSVAKRGEIEVLALLADTRRTSRAVA